MSVFLPLRDRLTVACDIRRKHIILPLRGHFALACNLGSKHILPLRGRFALACNAMCKHICRFAVASCAISGVSTFCRFEVTDPAADEVVLMCILQLLVTCVQCPSGCALSDEAVCEVVHSCFRISSQVRPPRPLREREKDRVLHHSKFGSLLARSCLQRISNHLPACDTACAPARRVAAADVDDLVACAVVRRTPRSSYGTRTRPQEHARRRASHS